MILNSRLCGEGMLQHISIQQRYKYIYKKIPNKQRKQ